MLTALLLGAGLLAAAAAFPVPAAADGKPFPPRDPWAADRPDDDGGKVDLGWSESPSPEIAAYRVYRSTQPGGPYTMLSERSTDDFINYLGYVDTGLQDGVAYYYVLTAVDRLGRESGPTAELSATPRAQLFRAAVSVRKSMVVSLAEQKLYCLENGRVVYVFAVSTGTGSTPTPTGNFRILYHDYAHPVPKYPGTICYYWMGFFEDYALHAWPTYNGVQGNYAGLGSPASHGCIRLHPDQAHIPYYWAPDGTPISIIPGRFQPPRQPVRGGHVAAAMKEPSDRWYFAEGYTGEGFDEYLVVLNPGDEPAVTYFDFMLPDGSVRSFTFTAGPHSRMTVAVDSLPGLESTDVSARITSTRPVVAERAMYFEYGGKTGGHATAGAPLPSDRWYFAEGYTGEGFDEYLVVLNPGDEPAVTYFDFMLPDGSVRSFTFTAGPHSRMTVAVDSLPGLESTDVSARITSTRPVVAERAMYFGYRESDDGHVCNGSPETSDRWYFAEGYTGEGFDEYLVVLNPGDEPAVTYFDFMLPDGSVRSFTFTAGPHSRMTVAVDSLPGLESTDVSARITSTRPVVAERTMYFGYRECPGGHAELGCKTPSNLHYLAEGYTSPFFDTWITVMNPGDADTTATVTFMKSDGGLVTVPAYVTAHSRATLKVNDVPGLENQEFSFRVESQERCLVERAVYFNYPR